jgi:replicative DNA helicase
MTPEVVKIRTLREVFVSCWEAIRRRTGQPEIAITSLPSLNKKLWGLKRKELLVVGGRTSQGKSTLALQIALDCAKAGLQTYYFSLEMSEEALVERIFCRVCNVVNTELLSEHSSYTKLAEKFYKDFLDLPLVVTYNIGVTKDDLEAAIEDLPKADVVIVDYLQAIRKMDFDKMTTVNNYILEFRRMAVEKNFAAVLVSQINRGAMDNETKKPQMWQLKGSGTIEEHADAVLLTHWPYFYDNKNINLFTLIVAKQRNGPTGEFNVYFEPEYYRFSEPKDPMVEKMKEIFDAKETECQR